VPDTPHTSIEPASGLQRWLICIGGGYGCFVFDGTEQEAEEMRRHKAGWEQAVARKRPASDIAECERQLDAFDVVDPWRAQKLATLTEEVPCV
jgi:hypothetical protein